MDDCCALLSARNRPTAAAPRDELGLASAALQSQLDLAEAGVAMAKLQALSCCCSYCCGPLALFLNTTLNCSYDVCVCSSVCVQSTPQHESEHNVCVVCSARSSQYRASDMYVKLDVSEFHHDIQKRAPSCLQALLQAHSVAGVSSEDTHARKRPRRSAARMSFTAARAQRPDRLETGAARAATGRSRERKEGVLQDGCGGAACVCAPAAAGITKPWETASPGRQGEALRR